MRREGAFQPIVDGTKTAGGLGGQRHVGGIQAAASLFVDKGCRASTELDGQPAREAGQLFAMFFGDFSPRILLD